MKSNTSSELITNRRNNTGPLVRCKPWTKGLSIALVCCVWIWGNVANGQSRLSPGKVNAIVRDAEQMMQQRMYPEAKSILQDLIKVDTTNNRAWVLLGNIAFLEREYEKASTYYYRYTSKLGFANQGEISLRLANIEFERGNYTQAGKILSVLASDSNANPQYKLARFTELKKLRWVNSHLSKPVGPEPQLMGPPLNSLPLQYLPSLSPDEQTLYFTGRTGQNNKDDEDIYIVEKKANGWSAPKSISEAVNSPYNEGACTISGDGNTLVFSVCESPNSKTGCDLYMSLKQADGSWSRPVNMDLVNSRYWDSQPCLNADGNELFFTSSRPGGLGKTDIWMSKRNPEGIWITPINCGPEINTTDEEGAPQLHANGKTLFFASKGHLGFGGFDLFYAERDYEDRWSAPINLGNPINTHHHESALFVNAKGTEAYLTRETKEPPTSHLWTWRVPASLTARLQCTVLKGRVLDEVTGKPIAAELVASPPDTKGQVYRVTSNAQTGQFLLVLPSLKTYLVHTGAKGYMFDIFQTNGLNRQGSERIVKLKPLVKQTGTTLAHLYFPTNGTQPLPESEAELQYLARYLKENSRTKVLIEGHTDDVGNTADNQLLSQRRAQSIVDYLKRYQIFETRLTAIGYGKSKPVVPNTSDANRARNRRINLLITPF